MLVPVTLGAMGLVLLPFIDPDTTRSRRIVKGLAAVAIVFMATMTVLALLAKTQ